MKCIACSREIDPEREFIDFETGLCELHLTARAWSLCLSR